MLTHHNFVSVVKASAAVIPSQAGDRSYFAFGPLFGSDLRCIEAYSKKSSATSVALTTCRRPFASLDHTYYRSSNARENPSQDSNTSPRTKSTGPRDFGQRRCDRSGSTHIASIRRIPFIGTSRKAITRRTFGVSEDSKRLSGSYLHQRRGRPVSRFGSLVWRCRYRSVGRMGLDRNQRASHLTHPSKQTR